MHQKYVTSESNFFTVICLPSIPMALNTVFMLIILKCIALDENSLLTYLILPFGCLLGISSSIYQKVDTSSPTPSKKGRLLLLIAPSQYKHLILWTVQAWKLRIPFSLSSFPFNPLIHNEILPILHKNIPLILLLSNPPSLLTWNHVVS